MDGIRLIQILNYIKKSIDLILPVQFFGSTLAVGFVSIFGIIAGKRVAVLQGRFPDPVYYAAASVSQDR